MHGTHYIVRCIHLHEPLFCLISQIENTALKMVRKHTESILCNTTVNTEQRHTETCKLAPVTENC